MRRFIAITVFPFWVGCATTTIHTGIDHPGTGAKPACAVEKTDAAEEGSFFAAAEDSPEKKAKFAADLPADPNADKSDTADGASKSRDVVINNSNGKPGDAKDKTAVTIDNKNADAAKDSGESFFVDVKNDPNADAKKAADADSHERKAHVDAGATVGPKKELDGYEQSGTASWYGRDFDGKRTASGEIFDSRKLTAAHRTLPLGTQLEVRNLENGRETVVVVNDRGPYVKGRIADLSERAAEALGYKEKGLTTVRIRVIAPGEVRERFPGATESFYAEAPDTKKPRMSDVVSADVKDNVPADASKDTESKESIYDRPAVQDPGEKPVVVKDTVKPVDPVRPSKSRKTNRVNPDEAAGVKKEGSTNAFAVQVGIFSDLARASEMKKTLSTYGKPVHILKRGEKYVVKVGSFKKKTEADALKSRLSGDGIGGFVSSNI